MQCKDLLTFELTLDSFCISAYKLKQDIPQISATLLERANEIEENNIRKLNSIYIASRRLSFKSIDYVLKVRREQQKVQEGVANRTSNAFLGVELDLANQMNELINSYFQTENFKQVEHDLAGDLGVNEYLPLIRIDNTREKSALESDVKALLSDTVCYGEGIKDGSGNSNNSYTCLDVIKIFLGVSSKNISYTFFKNNPYWGKYKEHDYKDVMEKVREIYIDFQVKVAQKQIFEEETYQAKRAKF